MAAHSAHTTEDWPKPYTKKWRIRGILALDRLLNPNMARPSMTRNSVLRVMMLGFGLTVLLVLVAAYFGYEGSQSIQQNAQDLVRENLLNTDRAAVLESRIESESSDLLRELALALGACFTIAASGAVLTIYFTNRAFTRIEAQERELTQVSWHLVDSHEAVSRRFSHEMHDELGQALTGVRAMVRRMTPVGGEYGKDGEHAKNDILNVLDEVMQDVREMSQMLRPVILDDFGLDAGLRWLTDRFSQRTGILIHYASDFTTRMAGNLETHLFRIGQEALTNIAKHSGATEAWVHLHVDATTVTLTIEDNGHGSSATPQPGRPSLGMVGMRARVRQVDGTLKAENRPEGGFRIQAEAPLKEREDAND